jgi:hypothetical protein
MANLKTLRSRHRRLALAAGLALTLSACALLGPKPSDEELGRRYLHRRDFSFVRIEPIEPSAPDNAHPFRISDDALRHMLGTVMVKDGIGPTESKLLTDEEMDQIVPHLTAALAAAGPKQDVTFASAGNRGLFGKYSARSVTTGRMFVRDGGLNVIFGVIHDEAELRQFEKGVSEELHPGSRTTRREKIVAIVRGDARFADSRPDWLIFDAAKTPAVAQPPTPKASTGTATAAPSTPAADGRYREIEDKLRMLEQLRKNNVITEEEYREQRRAILQRI